MKKFIGLGILLCVCTFGISGCGSKNASSTGNTNTENSVEANSEAGTSGEVTGSQNAASGKEENTSPKDDLAYEFLTDSTNQKIYDVDCVMGTDLYVVYLNKKKTKEFVMDAEGNTIFKGLSYIKVTKDKEYVYTYDDDTIKIYRADTHEEVTPEGINDNFSDDFYFISGDVVCTINGSYDLSTGKCLWKGENMNIFNQVWAFKGLLLGGDIERNYVLYNYLTGENLGEKIGEPHNNEFQINGAGYFCVQIGETIKVYDKEGVKISEFTVPSGHSLPSVYERYVMPGEHFAFYEDANYPSQLTITDMQGNIVREDVYMDEDSQYYIYYPYDDILQVFGGVGNREPFYAGVLDSSMNWVISQADNLYRHIDRYYGDIYYLKDVNEQGFMFNSTTKATLTLGEDFPSFADWHTENKLFTLGDKFYRTDTMELIALEYKESCDYKQIFWDTFAELDEAGAKATVYNMDGAVVTEIALDAGSEFVEGRGNSFVVKHPEKGYQLIKW